MGLGTQCHPFVPPTHQDWVPGARNCTVPPSWVSDTAFSYQDRVPGALFFSLRAKIELGGPSPVPCTLGLAPGGQSHPLLPHVCQGWVPGAWCHSFLFPATNDWPLGLGATLIQPCTLGSGTRSSTQGMGLPHGFRDLAVGEPYHHSLLPNFYTYKEPCMPDDMAP